MEVNNYHEQNRFIRKYKSCRYNIWLLKTCQLFFTDDTQQSYHGYIELSILIESDKNKNWMDSASETTTQGP